MCDVEPQGTDIYVRAWSRELGRDGQIPLITHPFKTGADRPVLRVSEIEDEPITILGYRQAEAEPFRDGFTVLEIVRGSGAHALVLTRSKVVIGQVEEFFAENPGAVCEEVMVVQVPSKRNPDRTYWTLDPAPVDVGDPEALTADVDEIPAETDQDEEGDEGDEEELDRQARDGDRDLEDICGGYTGLYLVFDVETTMDAAQNGRVLAWAVYGLRPLELHRAIAHDRKVDSALLDTCIERGLVYFPDLLFEDDKAACEHYAERHGMSCLSLDEFITETFYRYVIGLGAVCIGFNTAFDVSRLAHRFGLCRGFMCGGFAFKLCKCYGPTNNCQMHPNIRVKHVNNTIRFMDTVRPPFEVKEGYRRGRFLDVRTLAHALFDKKHSLESLSQTLLGEGKTEDDDEKKKVLRGPVNDRYLDYLCGDVDLAARCFGALRDIARGHHLRGLRLDKCYSGASIGKAYLRALGILPFLEKNPDFSNVILGYVMATYFGGRTEMVLRRETAEVAYLDFMSMYPTINTLLGLWDFWTSHHVETREAAEEVQDFLDSITLDSLLTDRTLWRKLVGIAWVIPDGDMLPVRTTYDRLDSLAKDASNSRTIGVNYLSGSEPLPRTISDLVADKLATGKTPRIVRALRFEPVGKQAGLRKRDIFGMPFDPEANDLFVFLQVARQRKKEQAREIKARQDRGEGTQDDAVRRDILEQEQTGLKVAGNSTAYGVTIEANLEDQIKDKTHAVAYFSTTHGQTRVARPETHGAFTNPILATSITGAARLLLAAGQAAAREAGLDYALCDPDSLGLVRPREMSRPDFEQRVRRVTDRFRALNPYPPEPWNVDADGQPRSILEVEDQNYAPGTDELRPLLLYGISSKRYALFNVRDAQGRYLDAEELRRRQKRRKTDDLRVEPRKVSASSLGSYMFPKPQEPIDEADLERARDGSNAYITTGQYEVWHAILTHAVHGDTSGGWQSDLPHFEKMPAMKQVTLGTTEVAKRFDALNQGKSYERRIKPFNFLLELPQLKPVFLHPFVTNGIVPWRRDRSMPVLGPFHAPFTTDGADLGDWREDENGDKTFWATKGNVRHTRDDELAGVKAGDVYTGPLMSLADALAQYGNHPESKFRNGGPFDQGRVRHRHLVAWGYRFHGKESVGFDPELGTWEDDPENVDYEPVCDDETVPEGREEQEPDPTTRSVTTLLDALRAIPRAWLAKRWGKSEREIQRLRNKHVHLSSKLRDEAARLIRLYRHQQESKAESDYKAEVLIEQKREASQRVKEALDAIRDMGRIKQPARLSTESEVSYARVLSDYRRRVPRSLRNAQGGGLPLDVVCAVLVEQRIYHGDADDLDAFGGWLHDSVAKSRKGVKTA